MATQYGYVQLPQDVVFEARGIRTSLPAGTMLPAADQFILSIIKEAWGDRPIYFAATTNAHRNLGLDRYVARQGVAYKLLTPQEAQAPGMVPMPQNQSMSAIYGAYLDLPRTQKLLWDTFEYRDLIEKDHWTDDATRGIPTYFAYAHVALAEGYNQTRRNDQVQPNIQRAEAWMQLSER